MLCKSPKTRALFIWSIVWCVFINTFPVPLRSYKNSGRNDISRMFRSINSSIKNAISNPYGACSHITSILNIFVRVFHPVWIGCALRVPSVRMTIILGWCPWYTSCSRKFSFQFRNFFISIIRVIYIKNIMPSTIFFYRNYWSPWRKDIIRCRVGARLLTSRLKVYKAVMIFSLL